MGTLFLAQPGANSPKMYLRGVILEFNCEKAIVVMIGGQNWGLSNKSLFWHFFSTVPDQTLKMGAYSSKMYLRDVTMGLHCEKVQSLMVSGRKCASTDY